MLCEKKWDEDKTYITEGGGGKNKTHIDTPQPGYDGGEWHTGNNKDKKYFRE